MLRYHIFFTCQSRLRSTVSVPLRVCRAVVWCSMVFEFSTLYFPESVRLYNGTDRCSGRVEVFHDGQWGKVCNHQWSPEAAEVVCKELNCGVPKRFQETFNYGDSQLKGVTARCSGSVTSLSQCTLQDYGGTCEAASLSCAGETHYMPSANNLFSTGSKHHQHFWE